MKSSIYGIHEITDMRELCNFKVACLSKAKSRVNTVKNPEILALIEQSITEGTKSVSQMKTMLEAAVSDIQQ